MRFYNIKFFALVPILFLLSCNQNILNSSDFSIIKDSLFPTTVNTSIPFSIGGRADLMNAQSCAVRSNSTVLCWGDNAFGQLGDGTFNTTHIPQQVLGGESGTALLNNVTKIVSGRQNVCALRSNGTVFCWGEGGEPLGTGDALEPDSAIPLRVVTGEQAHSSGFLSNITDITMGFDLTCALDQAGNIYCWGVCGNGRCGAGVTTPSSTPRAVVGGEQGGAIFSDARQIDVGRANGCAVTNTNDVYCWGDRRGLGTNLPAADVLTPVRVLGGDQGGAFLSDVQTVSVGWNRVCSLMLDSSVYCWGYNSFLGSGPPTETEGPTPRRVLGGAQGGTFLTDVVQMKQNFGNATCVITTTSELFCWGYIFGTLPSYLQSGEQSTTEPFFRNAQTIMMGPGSFCFIDNTNRTYCLGSNSSGALGFDPLVDGTNFGSLRFLEL